MKKQFPVATALTLVTFVVLILVPQAIPELKNYLRSQRIAIRP